MRIEQVSDSVYAVRGTNVNWGLVSDGSGVTVIDAGYPADSADLLKSVREIGHQLADVAAVLLTHAHLDHMGGIPALVEATGVPVYTGAEEAPHARREFQQQITPPEMAGLLGSLRGAKWVAQTAWAVKWHVGMSIPSATAGDAQTLAQLPGGLVAIPTHGHTVGHTAYLMPAEGVLFSGDTLVSGHPIVREQGPQVLPTVFNHDEQATRAAARSLAAYDAEVLVPGHGDVVREKVSVLANSLLQDRDSR
ncbi:MBL fold metallo-hydrolase [Nocardia sp. 2]|uniref:MBL fold metallo-hydrolase n=1 Tax=Nocardia acididurans TaxID=2802282 RepID=A0ABS1MH38_9NOCA|nr:MBL fold metallo-hydrolase [Nocardia acididurans]MBL1079375.1 MBL fold metallo-hydrolase [Nocardia acididurans]